MYTYLMDPVPNPKTKNSRRVLEISQSSWSRWDREGTVKKPITINPQKGEKIFLYGKNDEKYTLIINEVKDEFIHIKSLGLRMRRGVDTHKPRGEVVDDGYHSIVIKNKENAELNTYPMDIGVKWIITYKTEPETKPQDQLNL